MTEKRTLTTHRMLMTGLIAAVVTVLLGELPIGWAEYPLVPGDPTGLTGMMLGSAGLSLAQLASGALFGGVCIPLQYFGFEALARIVERSCPRAGRVMHAGALATGFLGGIVHVVCVALMFVCRIVCTEELTALPPAVWDFTLWLVMPVSVVFMPVYYAMTIALFIAVVRGRTVFPRWAAALNPLAATLVINALPLLLPGSALVNALGMANMGIGSVLTFGGLLALLPREEPADRT